MIYVTRGEANVLSCIYGNETNAMDLKFTRKGRWPAYDHYTHWRNIRDNYLIKDPRLNK